MVLEHAAGTVIGIIALPMAALWMLDSAAS
jgi:hypothetical protein